MSHIALALWFFLNLASCQVKPTSITLAFLGDVMLGRGVTPSAETFAYLAPHLSAADLVLANLESPLTKAPVQTESPYQLCTPPGNGSWLADWCIDLLTLANNHILDCGQAGLIETLEVLSAEGLQVAGPNPAPLYLEVKGWELAVLALDDVSAPIDIDRAVEAVRVAHDTGAIVIISIHWGMEYQGGASDRQVAIAEQLAEAGGTIIWGHHPHVLHGTSWLEDRQTLVLYSLGNALFDQYGLDDTRQGALVLVRLYGNSIQSAHAVPFEIDAARSRLVEPDQASSTAILERLDLSIP